MADQTKLRQPTELEFTAFSEELNALLVKHNMEIGVKSAIEILRRDDGSIPSDFKIADDGKGTPKTEEGSKA